MTVHYQDDQVTLHLGDCIEVLRICGKGHYSRFVDMPSRDRPARGPRMTSRRVPGDPTDRSVGR